MPQYRVNLETHEKFMKGEITLQEMQKASEVYDYNPKIHDWVLREKIETPVVNGKLVNIAKTDTPLHWFISEKAKEIIPSPAEKMIADILRSYKIEFYQEVSFQGLRLPTYGYPRFDFLIDFTPSQFILLEFDGELYHNTPQQIMRDNFKTDFCKMYHIELIRFNKQHYHSMELYLVDLLRRLGLI